MIVLARPMTLPAQASRPPQPSWPSRFATQQRFSGSPSSPRSSCSSLPSPRKLSLTFFPSSRSPSIHISLSLPVYLSIPTAMSASTRKRKQEAEEEEELQELPEDDDEEEEE